jgi:YesN/AraC family two-component response regulator
MRQAMEFKATAFLNKPIDRAALEKVLEAAAGNLPKKE